VAAEPAVIKREGPAVAVRPRVISCRHRCASGWVAKSSRESMEQEDGQSDPFSGRLAVHDYPAAEIVYSAPVTRAGVVWGRRVGSAGGCGSFRAAIFLGLENFDTLQIGAGSGLSVAMSDWREERVFKRRGGRYR